MTVLACGSAAGEVHNPLIIFPGRRFNYDPLDEFPEAHLLGRTMDGSMGSPSPPGSRLPSSLLHSSHVVQPLDLTTLKLLKQTWREEVMNYQEKNADIVGKREFSSVLKKAWIRGIQKDTVIFGFRAAGLNPWNPEHVGMSKLGPSRLYATTTDTETNSDTMTE
ncbi:hypothetical protein RRG08_041785 [Elysia crispata]|uniref:Uncharacterized protein n=2 Tax=Elysia crispata TaxID=231223 RepID=A0AAE1B7W0_9GAST|nr:hypothetical protein RRG08_041785 [Elysia crispata]